MTSTYTGWGECVNSTPPEIPRVIQRQKRRSSLEVFLYLYRHSDGNGRLALDASAASAATGFSRKTVYKVVRFLQRVNLLFLVEARTGRGNHSIYRLNWKKPEASTEAPSTSKKCHPPKNPRSVKYQHRSPEAPDPERPRWETIPSLRCRYLTSGWRELRKGQYGFKRAAKLLRLGCWDLGLSPQNAETISGLLLQRLQGQSAERVRKVHDRLFARLWERQRKLHALARRGRRRLCAWIGWLLQRVLTGIRAEERADERELVDWEAAEREQEKRLAELKRSSIDERRRHCRESIRVFVAAWEALHEMRIPEAEVEGRCAALAAEYGVPSAEIRAGLDHCDGRRREASRSW